MTEELFIARAPAPTIFGVGLIALDVIIVPNSSEKMWTGGSCGNVLTALNWLGWQSYPIANLRNDKPADIIYRDLDYWEIELGFLIRNETGRTPIIIEKLENNGIHRFMFKCPIRGTNLPRYKPISVDDVDSIVLQKEVNPSVFYFDRVSKSALTLAREFAERGTIIVFEPCSIRNKKLFREALQICHILKYSREQSKILEKTASRAESLLEIETLGSRGLRYRSNFDSASSEWKTMKAYKLAYVVDTAGAGDWCTAGIIHSLCREGLDKFRELSGNYVEYGLKVGQALAAFNCMFEGARGGMYLLDKDTFERFISDMLLNENSVDIDRIDRIERNERRSHDLEIGKISYTTLVKYL